MQEAEEEGVDIGIEALTTRITRWRRTRVKRTAMPEPLWAEAVRLAEAVGVYPVSRRLGVSFDRLKTRVLEAELARVREEPLVPAGFVELPATMLLGQATTLPRRQCVIVCELELARPDGARMFVRLDEGQEVDLDDLSGAFFGGAPCSR